MARAPQPRDAQKARRQRHKKRRMKRALVVTGLLTLTVGLGLVVGFGLVVSRLPSIDQLLAARPKGATVVYDRSGRVIASLQSGENRSLVKLEDIAEPMQKALVASEDARFHQHFGVDLRGLARAVFLGGKRGGGSTLTQQLAKVMFLNSDRTLVRKLGDMWLAIQLERRLSKAQILEMYLNQVYFGHGAYGVEAAARKYFAKPASRLTTAEAALLVGLIPAPEAYTPYRNPEGAKERQRLVLREMVQQGFLSAQEAEAEGQKALRFAGTPEYAYRAPYATSAIIAQLSERLGPELVAKGGLKIYSTIDLDLQEQAERILAEGVARAKARGAKVHQGALVAVEPGTGAVRALVGGVSYDQSPFNRAIQAHRQPGSTFKPFVYLTAFAKGYRTSQSIVDEPVRYGGYAPQNYDRRFHGAVSLERAVAFSYNIPAVKLGEALGMAAVVKMAHDLGIDSPMPEELAVTLGAAEVAPIELATAYATLGAEGLATRASLVERVTDGEGNEIERAAGGSVQVVAQSAVHALNRCLMAVINYGSGASARLDRPAAGKTGTTSDNRDTWFAGYTPDLACVVWLGNDDNSRLGGAFTGGVLAAPIWSRFMLAAHRGLPVRALPTGEGGPGVALEEGASAEAAASAQVDVEASVEAPPGTPTELPSVLEPSEAPGSPFEETWPSLEPSLAPERPSPRPKPSMVILGASPEPGEGGQETLPQELETPVPPPASAVIP